mmetsp:Transcript_15385/g.51831  ORF Transcript_15385/g.51831 Transcript_15385/m.51831 type:complete len:245 (-) Transcript_15385:530-1264(-)
MYLAPRYLRRFFLSSRTFFTAACNILQPCCSSRSTEPGFCTARVERSSPESSSERPTARGSVRTGPAAKVAFFASSVSRRICSLAAVSASSSLRILRAWSKSTRSTLTALRPRRSTSASRARFILLRFAFVNFSFWRSGPRPAASSTSASASSSLASSMAASPPASSAAWFAADTAARCSHHLRSSLACLFFECRMSVPSCTRSCWASSVGLYDWPGTATPPSEPRALGRVNCVREAPPLTFFA